MANTTDKLVGVVQGQVQSALADALGNILTSTYITNVTWDSGTSTLSFWCGSTLKYSCVINLGPVPLVDDPTKPLYLLSKQNGSTVTLGAVGTVGNTYQTSTDGTTWSNYTLGTSIPLDDGEGVYFRCTAFNTQFSYSAYVHFVMTGLIEAYHNINSMLSQSFDSLYDLSSLTYGGWCLNSLFEECASLTKAPLLPATTLSEGCYAAMFYFTASGQSQLVQPPTLPATTLASQCYSIMFVNCTSLTQAPTLSATTLATDCYNRMFQGCTSLTQAPVLPATTLATDCYTRMFQGCTSLTQAPSLPATTLSDQCYNGMFYGCTSLTQSPSLPATTLALYCYGLMFVNCTSLTQAPSLPATTLAHGCYQSMFQGCTSLTQAPTLPATTLVQQCYESMFYGCSLLNEIHIKATNKSATNCINNWLYNVASSGNFYCEPGVLYPAGASGIPTNWVRHDVPAIEDDVNKPLYLLSKQDGSEVILTKQGSHSTVYQTSTDNITWADYTYGTAITLNKGEGVYFRIKTARTSAYSTSLYVTFKTSTGIIEAYHNVNSMISPDFTNLSSLADSIKYALVYLFGTSGTSNYLKKAPLLPSTTLKTYCYSRMFCNCTGLTMPPTLPATTLATWCYSHMFEGCTSLTEVPALPSTALYDGCYGYMFDGCTRLLKSPDLPATVLTESSYTYMFRNCSLLSEVRIHATNTQASSCMSYWLSSVSASGDFYCDPNKTFPSGTSGIPSGWTRRDINDYPST